jgi:small multidrug resistance pump
MSYLYFAIAVVSEILATMTLKATCGFTRFWPSVVVIAGVCSSLYFFGLCLKTLNVAIVYAVWSGIGICTVTTLGWLIYGQQLDSPALIGIALILAGVLVIQLWSQTVEVPEASAAKPFLRSP